MLSRKTILSLIPKLFLLGLIFFAHTTFAQQDSITHHYDSLAKIKLQALDSSGNKFNNKVDSLQQRLNNVLNPNFNNLTSKLKRKKLQPQDTLQATHELDSMKRGITYKIDSLKALKLPTDQYTRKLDSLNKINPSKYIETVNQKIQSAENVVNKPVSNIENKINDKLNVMRQEGGANANLPGNLSTNNLPTGNLPTNSLPLDPNIKTDINGLNNPIKDINNPLGDQANQLGDLKGKVGDMQNLPQQEISKIQSIDEVNAAKQKLGSANQITDKVQSYEGDAKNIANGNLGEVKELPKAIESKATNLDQVKDLQKQSGEITKMQGELDKIKGAGNDPEKMKELAKQEIQKQAVNHFQGKEQVLQQAMDKMNKLKSKYSEVSSLKDIKKIRPHSLKGKPLIERIVPGFTFQIQKFHSVAIDFNPVVSYRFTDRINSGLGWNERFAFTKWNKLSPNDRIFGPRVFGSFSFKKGFSVKAEVEKMNVLIPSTPFAVDGSREWIWSVFVGLKKDYTFIGKVRGNVQMLYNLYDDHNHSPYMDRFNVRMGFEFPMKKKPKAPK